MRVCQRNSVVHSKPVGVDEFAAIQFVFRAWQIEIKRQRCQSAYVMSYEVSAPPSLPPQPPAWPDSSPGLSCAIKINIFTFIFTTILASHPIQRRLKDASVSGHILQNNNLITVIREFSCAAFGNWLTHSVMETFVLWFELRLQQLATESQHNFVPHMVNVENCGKTWCARYSFEYREMLEDDADVRRRWSRFVWCLTCLLPSSRNSHVFRRNVTEMKSSIIFSWFSENTHQKQTTTPLSAVGKQISSILFYNQAHVNPPHVKRFFTSPQTNQNNNITRAPHSRSHRLSLMHACASITA